MFADIELIGILHRVVVSERGWRPGRSNTARAADAPEQFDRDAPFTRLSRR